MARHIAHGDLPQGGWRMNPAGEKTEAVKLSLVIPVFNEGVIFDQLKNRLIAAIPLLPAPVEIVLVNDGSTDETGKLMSELCRQDGRFVGVHLARNFGHQMAVCAGLEIARGEAVAVLDGDLQDPPEILPVFYA